MLKLLGKTAGAAAAITIAYLLRKLPLELSNIEWDYDYEDEDDYHHWPEPRHIIIEADHIEDLL